MSWLCFLTFGLLFGALWAKEAWGHYWTWDPKETWAFITWMGYLVYIHRRYQKPSKYVSALWILALAFVILLVCWFGVNYLPSAQFSVHTYSMQP
ncbi:cytochrome c biogenesis protein CcsA [Marinifilum fragile]|uniref:cytochrome c biogenesis protein CcsA n=1 Tax=Marinifilum fragile TaxID=570161 RepID=UPI001C45EC52